MKKTLLTLSSLLYFITCSFAQQDTTNHKWSIGLQINTPERKIPYIEDASIKNWDEDYLFSYGDFNGITKDKTFAINMVANCYLNDNSFLRFRVGFNKVDIELLPIEYLDPTGTTLGYYNAWKKRSDFIVAPGIGRSIEIKHFNFYAGFDMPYTYYGKAETYRFYQYNDVKTESLLFTQEVSGTILKAYSIGVGNFAGFAFKMNHISIGGEISYAFLYSKSLSGYTMHSITNDFQNNNSTTTDNTYNPILSNFDISKIKGSLMLTYSF